MGFCVALPGIASLHGGSKPLEFPACVTHGLGVLYPESRSIAWRSQTADPISAVTSAE